VQTIVTLRHLRDRTVSFFHVVKSFSALVLLGVDLKRLGEA
jgi:hypothetical protein